MKQKPEEPDQFLSVKIPAELKSKCITKANLDRRSLSSWVRKILEKAVAK